MCQIPTDYGGSIGFERPKTGSNVRKFGLQNESEIDVEFREDNPALKTS